MLFMFFSDSGRILFTHTGDELLLCEGDFVMFRDREYIITKKRFDVSSHTIEFSLREMPSEVRVRD